MLAHPCRKIIALTFCVAISSQSFAQYPPQQYYYQPTPDYYKNNTAEGTVLGGGFGAIAGALIGSSEGKSPEGALIGAATGAIAGNLLGRSKDRVDQQRANNGFAVAQQANQRVAATALSNYDLIQLTRAGIDDSVILNAIQTRGGNFDVSPNGLIALKQSGVSDQVLSAAQRYAVQGPTVINPPPPTTTIIHEPAPIIVHRPYPPAYHWHFRYCR